jgi:ribosomal protein S4E
MSKSCQIDMHTGQNRRTESEEGTSRQEHTFSSDIIGIGTDEQDTSGKVVFQQGTNARVTHEQHLLQFGTAGKGTHQAKAHEQCISGKGNTNKVHSNKLV